MFGRGFYTAVLSVLTTVPLSAGEIDGIDPRGRAADCARRAGGACQTCQRHAPPCCCPERDLRTQPESGSRDQPGIFVAPPRSGTVVEESGSVGIRGITLHFPEVRFGLPTIEFPSLVRYRSHAHMKLDHGVAPFVPLPAGGTAAPGSGRQEEPFEPESGEATNPGSAEDLAARCRQLAKMKAELLQAQQELQTKVDRLHQSLRQLESCQPRCMPGPLPPPELPAPTVDPNALYPGVEDESERETVFARTAEQLHPLPSPQGPEEGRVRPSSYVTRSSFQTLQRLPPVRDSSR